MAHQMEGIISEAYAAFARGDLDGYFRACSEDWNFNIAGRGAIAGTYRGKQRLYVGFDLLHVNTLDRSIATSSLVPHRPGSELVVGRIEIQVMDAPIEMPRYVETTLHERPVDDHLRRDIRDLARSPGLDCPDHRLEVALHVVYARRQRTGELKILGVLRQERLEVAMNTMAKLPFELSVPISRARLKPHRGTGIVES